jgi:type VI protein secretion system component VasK
MIKPLRLVRVAAKAQGLALRRQIAGVVRRAILWVIAGIFALGALIVLHVIGYMALGEYAHFQPIASAAIVLGVDVLIAAIFGFLASATASDPILVEAVRVRDQSLEQARQSLTLASMVAPLTRVLSDMGILRAALGLVKAGFRRRREG